METFIKNKFQLRKCDRYKKLSKSDICECGNVKQAHNIIESNNVPWSYENNTILNPCNRFGSIAFEGYDDVFTDYKSKFVCFNCENESNVEVNVFELMNQYWKFTMPKLLISVIGGFKRMDFKTHQQKKNFQQGLIEVLKRDTTWIIGGGFNVGIHKLIGEAVHEYRLFHNSRENHVKLIGICTWGVVRNNHSLLKTETTYTNSNDIEKGKVTLDGHYDCFLFCDDGTERQYDKEVDFRLKFEKYVQQISKYDTSTVQILFEGGQRALESAYKSLTDSVPLVVIKGSGRAADIICKVVELNLINHEEDITNILLEYQDQLRMNKNLDKFQNYLINIYTNYKSKIFIHDLLDQNMKLDKTILEAIVSSGSSKLEKLLELTIRFNCHDIAEIKVFQDIQFPKLEKEFLNINFENVLSINRSEFVHLFLENNFDIQQFFSYQVLDRLYNKSKSPNSCRCSDLLKDLIFIRNKTRHNNDKQSGDIISSVNKIIRDLSGNILKKNNSKTKKLTDKDEACRELFLWALLSGYLEMAEIFWMKGNNHIGSALIATIILKKMRNLALERGDRDMSEGLLISSNKFQEMAACIVMEAFDNNQKRTYQILSQPLEGWNKLSCLQIAISGKLLEFLNLSACRSYTNTAWMGELYPLLPTWKILLTIPFSLFLLKPLIIPTFSETNVKQVEFSAVENSDENDTLTASFSNQDNQHQDIAYIKAFKKFYQAPKVKFVIYLISYIIFLLVFANLNLLEMKPLNEIKGIKDVYSEIFVYVYIIAIFIEEIRQILDQERIGKFHQFKSYLSGSWNIYDIIVFLLFIISTSLRFILPNEYFTITKCFFSITLSLFCLRSMQFYFISRSIGPKVIMIRKMMVDILFFLSIFVLFIISYGILVQSLLNEHNQFSLSLIKDIFYRPYFQSYGELMLDDFNVPSTCNTTTCIFKYSTIIGGFGIFLLLSNILLINLLIAMFGHTFNRIQEESENFFAFIQIQLVEEFYKKPLLPPPFTIFYYISMVIMRCFSLRFSNTESMSDTFLVKSLSSKQCNKISGFERICMNCILLKKQADKDNIQSSLLQKI